MVESGSGRHMVGAHHEGGQQQGSKSRARQSRRSGFTHEIKVQA
jgi:hypothetical protein